jgi:hypothetical protein
MSASHVVAIFFHNARHCIWQMLALKRASDSYVVAWYFKEAKSMGNMVRP